MSLIANALYLQWYYLFFFMTTYVAGLSSKKGEGFRSKKKDKDRWEGKSRRLFWGTYLILICRTNHLAARMIWRKKVVGKTTILVGWLFGMVGTGWSSLFQSIHSAKYHSLAFILLILFYKIILVENIWCGREFNQFCRPNSSDDVCLLFCRYPSYLHICLRPFLLDKDPTTYLLSPWQ